MDAHQRLRAEWGDSAHMVLEQTGMTAQEYCDYLDNKGKYAFKRVEPREYSSTPSAPRVDPVAQAAGLLRKLSQADQKAIIADIESRHEAQKEADKLKRDLAAEKRKPRSSYSSSGYSNYGAGLAIGIACGAMF